MQVYCFQSSCFLGRLANDVLLCWSKAGQGVGAACCAEVETAAHFNIWQRSGCDAQNRRQDLWPPLLRAAPTIPGVEYIQVLAVRGIFALLAEDLRAWTTACLFGHAVCAAECRAMRCAHMALTSGLQSSSVLCIRVTDTYMPENIQQSDCVAGMLEKRARSCSMCYTKQFMLPRQQIDNARVHTSRLQGVQWVSLQATRARGQLIKELKKFFFDNHIDAFLGGPLFRI